MKFGTIGKDGCPCGEYVTEHAVIRVHCWRSGVDCACPYSGIHYYTKSALATDQVQELKDYISEVWRTDVNIIEEKCQK